jgi:hypothetical protein
VKPALYQTGEPILKADRVRYHGESGTVEFVIAEKAGDPALDWYVDEYPGGGVMLNVATFGSIFLSEYDDDLIFVSRAPLP